MTTTRSAAELISLLLAHLESHPGSPKMNSNMPGYAEAYAPVKAWVAQKALLQSELADAFAGCAKRVYVRFGALPCGVSRNHREGCAEAGVSVYDAWQFGGSVYLLENEKANYSSVWFEDRKPYLVSGTPLESTGGDGETLLAVGCKQKALKEVIVL